MIPSSTDNQSSGKTLRQELREYKCILNLIYQREVQPISKIPWHKLSNEELIKLLGDYGICREFIEKNYASELKSMERKREEIEIFTYSRPPSSIDG